MMELNMKTLNEINEYVKNQRYRINEKYRLKYHLMPPVGWMNDPNGLLFFKGKYHLFYQYNPFSSLPGIMLWGHATSEDLIHFKDEEVALVPTDEHTSIFSGGAIEIDGVLNAIYTLHYEQEGEKREEVYLAKSEDGFHFSKPICVFDNQTLPDTISKEDFRDPYPIQVGDMFYVLVGGKNVEKNQGLIVVLKGTNLEQLQYAFTIGPFYELGDMGECPSYHKVDGKDVLLVSGCHVQNRENDFKNMNSSVFIVGNLDLSQGKMQIDFIKEIDKGDTFYAPQFINGIKEPVMIGWLEMWGKEYPTHELGHHWVGAFSIPRKLTIQGTDICQMPVDSVNKYHLSEKTPSKCLDIRLTFESKGRGIISGRNGKVIFGLEDYFYLDATQSNNKNGYIRRTNQKYESCSIRVLLDISSIEIFIDGGREAISSRIYLDGEYQISFDSSIKDVKIKEVGA